MKTSSTVMHTPAQTAYYRAVNRFIGAVAVGAAAWLVVLCMQGAVLLYDAPATLGRAADWVSWLTYPPAALETVVGAMLLLVFRPREGKDRIVRYTSPEKFQRARWMCYGIVVAPLPFAVAWLA